MLRVLFKSLFIFLLVTIIAFEIRWLYRLVGPEIEPYWERAKAKARSHGLGFEEKDVSTSRSAP